MNVTRAAFAATIVILLSATSATAATFSVAPLKLFFEKANSSAVLRVRNTGAKKTSIQAHVRNWTVSEDGRDVYQDTDDFVFFPRIFEVEPGAEGMVRIAYRGDGPGESQEAFRIFLSELPTASRPEPGVGFILELSVPMFVGAAGTRPEGVLTGAELDGGWVVTRVDNRGSAFFVVESLQAVGRAADGGETFRVVRGGWYVLAASTRPFALDVPAEACRSTASITAEAFWDGQPHAVEFPVDPHKCSSENLPPPPGAVDGR